MTTLEFKASLLSSGQITVPADIAEQIPAGKDVQVILSWETPVEGDSFHTLGQKLRENSYASEASVFDSFA